MTAQTSMTDIDGLIAAVEERALDLGRAVAWEQSMEDDRAVAKSAAIRRLMDTTNALTGKQHSASSADAVVETDPDYREYRRLQGLAVVEKHELWGMYEAAKLRAQRAVGLEIAMAEGSL